MVRVQLVLSRCLYGVILAGKHSPLFHVVKVRGASVALALARYCGIAWVCACVGVAVGVALSMVVSYSYIMNVV